MVSMSKLSYTYQWELHEKNKCGQAQCRHVPEIVLSESTRTVRKEQDREHSASSGVGSGARW
jgi:hypothetical protein